jgi:hypothetical protein
MMFAVSDAENPILWILGGILVWMLFMMTFRTRDFLDLMKADEERKKRRAEERNQQLGLGLSFLRWWFGNK